MARYFITAQTVTLSCGIITISMISKPDEHLWLLYSTHAPYLDPRNDRRSNNTVPHQINYILNITGEIEQQEPGSTIFHTFQLTFPLNAQYLFFYTINLTAPPNKPSRSAIYAYQLRPINLLYEPFIEFPINPDLHWTGFNALDGTISCGNGRLSAIGLASTTSNVPNLGYFNLSLNPALAHINPCDINMSFSIPQNVAGTAAYSATVTINLTADDTGQQYFFQFTPKLPGDYQSTWPLRGLGNAGLFLISKPTTVNLRHLLTNLPQVVSSSFTYYPSGNVTLTALGIGTYLGLSSLPSPFLQSYGPITIADTAGQLIDISKTWRHRHITLV